MDICGTSGIICGTGLDWGQRLRVLFFFPRSPKRGKVTDNRSAESSGRKGDDASWRLFWWDTVFFCGKGRNGNENEGKSQPLLTVNVVKEFTETEWILLYSYGDSNKTESSFTEFSTYGMSIHCQSKWEKLLSCILTFIRWYTHRNSLPRTKKITVWNFYFKKSRRVIVQDIQMLWTKNDC